MANLFEKNRILSVFFTKLKKLLTFAGIYDILFATQRL